jgi:hypothetical protein
MMRTTRTSCVAASLLRAQCYFEPSHGRVYLHGMMLYITGSVAHAHLFSIGPEM